MGVSPSLAERGDLKHAVGSNRSSSEHQFFFLHIPKTAGKSFESFLCSHFEADKILLSSYWETIRKQPISALANFQLITGHIGYDLAFYLKNPFIFTLLRHPVDRLCSVYEYLKQYFRDNPDFTMADPDVNALVQLWKEVVQRPFTDFLESTEDPVRAALLENPQGRQLAQPTPYLLTDFSDDHLYQLASSRLSRIDIVGSVEHFAETVELACRRIGWEVPNDFNQYHLNITEKRPVRDSMDATLHKRIERLSAVDMELYTIAEKRLAEDLRDEQACSRRVDKC
jgi:Sulfotransferase family